MNRYLRRALPWLIVGLLLLGLVLGVIRAVKARQSLAQTAPSEATVSLVELAPSDLVEVQRHELGRSIAVSGGLKAVRTAQVKAKVAGELQELVVREGESVRAGQVLGRIDPTEYAARLRQAQEQAASAQAQWEIAERTLANNRALVDQGFISRNALETSISNAAAARTTRRPRSCDARRSAAASARTTRPTARTPPTPPRTKAGRRPTAGAGDVRGRTRQPPRSSEWRGRS